MNAAPVCRAYVMLHAQHSELEGYVTIEEQSEYTSIHVQLSGISEDSSIRALLVSGCGERAVLDLGLLSVYHGQGSLHWTSKGPMSVRCWDAAVMAADWPSGQVLAMGMLREPAECTAHDVQQAIEHYLHLPCHGAVPLPPREESLPVQKAAPVLALPRLVWPAAFMQIKVYFDRLLPCAPFDAPGWRFVQVDAQADTPAPWIILGRYVQGHAVQRICWAVPGPAHPRPAGLHGYTWVPGQAPDGYWLLMQDA